ncbi:MULTISPECIES: hypothetical protein [Roseovarius]|uniref:DUF3015 domain-containing protein n=1 Tax=Roseovarius nubinhibens (strain ATCC BAA-591 / DSM 15170 / ISM) TaxID=89187 RepID=A3SQQ2_ROSNI|nr:MULTISPECIES: hypothetical protein [Roseovarius]EAP75461.1 hypothetical protein ISM_10071 [Roseovarius nubinhibens ISM]MAO26725.1 hypothetical protein [Roseovarius sp.]MAZ22551.1 hypothetical protein [Roseovarius sp.]MBU2998492.1 hypothetical protein [Roseovarius nubinhibens]|tara:strand:- start:157 stop:513 length:357 start_codon:yes stop_codon:yes gene_type:complete
MKHLLTASLVALSLTAGAAQANPCVALDFDLKIAVQDALMGAEDPRVSRLAGYLNDSFYNDLSCRMTLTYTGEALQALLGNPPELMKAALTMPAPRNQSDALILILQAMQATVDELPG